MRYRFGVEDIEPGHWVAWALDVPGCFSSGQTQQEAVAGAPDAVAAFVRWRSERGRPLATPDESIEIAVEEVFHSFQTSTDYVVNAFFADDARPLHAADIEEARWLLTHTRQDLCDALGIAPAQLRDETPSADQHDSVSGILRHIAVAERWYLAMLGFDPFDQALPPENPLLALEQTRQQTLRHLGQMADDGAIRERRGERWSARKVLRRIFWHERDHTQQIVALRVG